MGLSIEKRSREINGTLIYWKKMDKNPVAGNRNAVILGKSAKTEGVTRGSLCSVTPPS